MRGFRARDPLDRIFEVGIILKGLDGVLEAIGGLLLLAVTPATINRLVARLTQHELSEDPNDFIARHLLGYAHGLTGSAVIFAAVYLLVHGIIKIVLVAALLRNQVWAYPWMIGFLLIFIGYQLYRLALSPTFWLTALTIFDALIVWLTWREWRRQTADRAVGVRDSEPRPARPNCTNPRGWRQSRGHRAHTLHSHGGLTFGRHRFNREPT